MFKNKFETIWCSVQVVNPRSKI